MPREMSPPRTAPTGEGDTELPDVGQSKVDWRWFALSDPTFGGARPPPSPAMAAPCCLYARRTSLYARVLAAPIRTTHKHTPAQEAPAVDGKTMETQS